MARLCEIFTCPAVSLLAKRACPQGCVDNSFLSNDDAQYVMAFITLLPEAGPLQCDFSQLFGPETDAEYQVSLFDHKVKVVDANDVSRADILVYSTQKHSAELVDKYVTKLAPKVLFHNSDEYLDKTEPFKTVFEKVALVYRQYCDPRLDHPSTKIKTLPVGYHCWDFQPSVQIKPASERLNTWVFVGTVKPARRHVLNQIDDLPHEILGSQKSRETGRSKTIDNAMAYSNAQFTYCPHGLKHIDNSRPYAAALNGCVPIILCSREEFEQQYGKMEPPAPFLHAETAEEMRRIMQTADATVAQKQVIEWWEAFHARVRENCFAAIAS
jgi:hypothetical protein